MDFSWSCTAATSAGLAVVCTASADLVAWASLMLEAAWFVAGSLIAGVVVITTAVTLFRRI